MTGKKTKKSHNDSPINIIYCEKVVCYRVIICILTFIQQKLESSKMLFFKWRKRDKNSALHNMHTTHFDAETTHRNHKP